jgi:hypothetical protein
MSSRQIISVVALVTAIGAGLPTAARADIIFDTGVNNQGTDNVLLDDAVEQAIITGTLNSGAFDVEFTSTGGNLNAVASGQARVTPGAANDPFVNLLFGIVGSTFTRAVFNINAATDGDLTIRVTENNGDVNDLATTVDANGQNFFTVDAINGQRIATIELLAGAGVVFEDLRQVRLGGGDVPDVHEPAALLLVAGGVQATARRARRGTR